MYVLCSSWSVFGVAVLHCWPWPILILVLEFFYFICVLLLGGARRGGGSMVFRTFTLPRRPKKIAPPSRRAAAAANAAAFTLPILLGKGTDTPVTLDHVSDWLLGNFYFFQSLTRPEILKVCTCQVECSPNGLLRLIGTCSNLHRNSGLISAPFLSQDVEVSRYIYFLNWLMKLKYPNLRISESPSNKF